LSTHPAPADPGVRHHVDLDGLFEALGLDPDYRDPELGNECAERETAMGLLKAEILAGVVRPGDVGRRVGAIDGRFRKMERRRGFACELRARNIHLAARRICDGRRHRPGTRRTGSGTGTSSRGKPRSSDDPPDEHVALRRIGVGV
jgi:hypothetical protein